jgi:GNAT superfamily N-acetyltransferase
VSAIDFRRVAPRDPDAVALAEAHVEEGRRLYANWPRSPAPSLDELLGPGDRMLVAYRDGEPLACGAVRVLEPGTAEIKRMFVAAAARGRGLGRRLLARLEAEAVAMGIERVRLDTGARQVEALGLYRSSGYREIDDYNGNAAAAHWFEKRLAAA